MISGVRIIEIILLPKFIIATTTPTIPQKAKELSQFLVSKPNIKLVSKKYEKISQKQTIMDVKIKKLLTAIQKSGYI
jgi:hypothetical protein